MSSRRRTLPPAPRAVSVSGALASPLRRGRGRRHRRAPRRAGNGPGARAATPSSRPSPSSASLPPPRWPSQALRKGAGPPSCRAPPAAKPWPLPPARGCSLWNRLAAARGAGPQSRAEAPIGSGPAGPTLPGAEAGCPRWASPLPEPARAGPDGCCSAESGPGAAGLLFTAGGCGVPACVLTFASRLSSGALLAFGCKTRSRQRKTHALLVRFSDQKSVSQESAPEWDSCRPPARFPICGVCLRTADGQTAEMTDNTY